MNKALFSQLFFFHFLIAASTSGISSTTSEVSTNPDTTTFSGSTTSLNIDLLILQFLNQIEALLQQLIQAIQERIQELFPQQGNIVAIRWLGDQGSEINNNKNLELEFRSSSTIDLIEETLTNFLMEFVSGSMSLDNLEMIETNLTLFVNGIDDLLVPLTNTTNDIAGLNDTLEDANNFLDAVVDFRMNLTQTSESTSMNTQTNPMTTTMITILPSTTESANPTSTMESTMGPTTAETTVNTFSTVSTASPDTVCTVPENNNNNNNNFLPSYSTTTNNQILFRYEFFECDQDYAMCLNMVFNCNNQKVTSKNAKLRKRSRCSFMGEFEDQACISVSSDNCTDSNMPMKDWTLHVS